MSDDLRNVFEGIYVHGVPREMTPDKAQQMLDAATGTPFEERTNALEALDAYTVHPAVKELLIEAPALARVVAGLTEEWGVTTEFEGGGAAHTTWRFGSREAAEHYAEAGIVNRSIVPTAIVRRLVGPVEVVE